MGILFGLTTALLWGAGDFLARYVTHSLGTYRTLFFIQFIGLVCLGIYLLATGELLRVVAMTSWQPWLWALLASLLNIGSSFALYRAFEVGSLTLVSPIAASYAAVTIVLAFLSGEALTQSRDIGIGLVLFGIIVASTTFKFSGASETPKPSASKSVFDPQRLHLPALGEFALLFSLLRRCFTFFTFLQSFARSAKDCRNVKNVKHLLRSDARRRRGDARVKREAQCDEDQTLSTTSEEVEVVESSSHAFGPVAHRLLLVLKRDTLQGIWWAMVASIGYGTTFWILGFHVTPMLGSIIPVWLIRTLTPCVLVVCAPFVQQRLTLPRGSIWWFIVGVSIFDTVAYITYTLGLAQGQISLITILSSLYSAVTVLLAWIFLRERLQRSQWFGIGVIFVGIALVNI